MPTARVLLFTVVLGLIGCGKDKDGAAPVVPEPPAVSQAEPAAPSIAPSRPAEPAAPKEAAATPPATGWTTDVKAMVFPASPAAGTVNGQPFTPQTADISRIRGRFLTLRQGDESNPDAEVRILLAAGKDENFAGKTYEVAPDAGPAAPAISVARKTQERPAEPALFTEKYALRLEFGQENAGKLLGRIYLCLPDESKSTIAGTFTADIEPDYAKLPRPEESPCVVGRITLKGRAGLEVITGFLGVTTAGAPASNLTGTTIATGTETSVASATYPPQRTVLVNDAEAGCQCRHSRLAPGRYLFFVGTGERYIDWHWVEVRDGAMMTLDFTLEPEVAGTLAVVLPKDAKEGVRLIPLDDAGKVPDVKPALDLLSLAMRTDVDARDGKVLLEGLRPGRYRAIVGDSAKDVTIKAKESVEVDLSAP
jgi:hypothetical protein